MDEKEKEEFPNGQVSLPEEGEKDNPMKSPGRSKRDYYIEMALFLILGVLMGIAIKTEAIKRITIGYNDYKMNIRGSDYNINKLEEDLIKKSAEEQGLQGQEESGASLQGTSGDESGQAVESGDVPKQ